MIQTRDNFTLKTIDLLAKRAGYLCSNPLCRTPTIGSNLQENKATIIGEGADICGASPGGERYDSEMSSKERKSINNGIWLCCNCATLIDKDSQKYSSNLLKEWKLRAEDESSMKLDRLNRGFHQTIPFLEGDFIGFGRTRVSLRVSQNNPKGVCDGRPTILMTESTLHFWRLNWRYTFLLVNNSTIPAFNVSIESIGNLHLTEMENIRKINNIPPLDKMEIKVTYEEVVESDYQFADTIMRPRYPSCFENLKLKILYFGADRAHQYSTLLYFKDQEIVNLSSN